MAELQAAAVTLGVSLVYIYVPVCICIMDGALSLRVYIAANKWRSSGSGGCQSSRVPRSSWLLGRARVELEPHIRY